MSQTMPNAFQWDETGLCENAMVASIYDNGIQQLIIRYGYHDQSRQWYYSTRVEPNREKFEGSDYGTYNINEGFVNSAEAILSATAKIRKMVYGLYSGKFKPAAIQALEKFHSNALASKFEAEEKPEQPKVTTELEPQCQYCKNNLVKKLPGNAIYIGFLDADMGIHVCPACKTKHYNAKMKTEHRGKFSEMPIPVRHEKVKVYEWNENNVCTNPDIITVYKDKVWLVEIRLANLNSYWYTGCRFQRNGTSEGCGGIFSGVCTHSELRVWPCYEHRSHAIHAQALDAQAYCAKAPAKVKAAIEKLLNENEPGDECRDYTLLADKPVIKEVDGLQQIVLPLKDFQSTPEQPKTATLYGYVATNKSDRQRFKRKLERTREWLTGLSEDEKGPMFEMLKELVD